MEDRGCKTCYKRQNADVRATTSALLDRENKSPPNVMFMDKPTSVLRTSISSFAQSSPLLQHNMLPPRQYVHAFPCNFHVSRITDLRRQLSYRNFQRNERWRARNCETGETRRPIER